MIAITKAFGCAGLAIVASLSGSRTLAATPEAPMAAFLGAWTLNLSKTRMERAGPNGAQTVRAASFTWVFKATAGKVDLNIYHQYPAPAPSKVMAVVTDGRFHPCRMKESCLSTPGDPKEQSFAFLQVDPNMAMRVFKVRGVITEYNIYTVSSDRKTFIATSWSPGTPEYRNVQVFEKQL